MRSFFLTPRVLVCVTGLVLSVPSYAFLGGLAGSLGALTKAIPGTAAIPSPAAQAVAGNCGEPGALPTANNACAPAASAAAMLLKKTRPPEQLDSLLNGQEVSGEQLMAEVKAMQSSLSGQNLNKAMESMLGATAAGGVPNLAAMSNSSGFFSSIMGSATDMLLDSLVAGVSYQALDHFFATMASKPGLLKEVTVTMPKADASMTPDMKQQLVNMAGFLVAIKASGKIIDASMQDFDAAKDSYAKVLDTRMAAAKVLGDAFFARAGLEKAQEENKAYLTAEQSQFLEAMRDKKPDDLMKDFAVQNIALDYLRKKDPAKYGDYKAGVNEFKSHYGAYARTSVGAASMVGFSSLFLKRAKNMLEKNGLAVAPYLLPLVGSGLTETLTLAPRVTNVISSSPDLQEGSFAVRTPKGDIQGALSAEKAFALLNDESLTAFQAELFKDGQLGFFGNLGEKFPQASARVLDSLVQKDTRAKLSKNYFEREDWPDFSFQNVLAGQGENVDSKQLRQFKSDLFRSAPAQTATNLDQQSIAQVQTDVRERLAKWDNSTLRQIMLSNRTKAQAGVELALNGYVLSVDSPGMKGIMDYEEMVAAGAEHATTRSVTSDRALKAQPETPAKSPVKGKGKSTAKK